jgi:hypothetical protein
MSIWRTRGNAYYSSDYIRFEVIMVVNIKIMVSWDVITCSLVHGHHCFRGTCCHHLQGRSNKLRKEKWCIIQGREDLDWAKGKTDWSQWLFYGWGKKEAQVEGKWKEKIGRKGGRKWGEMEGKAYGDEGKKETISSGKN